MIWRTPARGAGLPHAVVKSSSTRKTIKANADSSSELDG